MHACVVYKVILAVAQRILFKSLSLKWFLLHLHISEPGGKTRINFNKTETAIERQTTIRPSDFVFNLGVTAATWLSNDKQLAFLTIC